MARIMTGAQLADLLKSFPATKLAREAQVSRPTIYNLREQKKSPTLKTMQKLLAAVERLQKA